MEYVVNACTTLAFSGDIADEATLQLLAVLLEELADEVENDGPLAILIHGQVLRVVREQLALLLLDRQRDLLAQLGDAALDVADEDSIEGLC